MVELEFKPLNWFDKKELLRILEQENFSLRRLIEFEILPISFIEKAFLLGVKGFEDPEKLPEQLNNLDYETLVFGASRIFEKEILNVEREKKS